MNLIFMIILYYFFLWETYFKNDCTYKITHEFFYKNNNNHQCNFIDIFRFKNLGKILFLFNIFLHRNNSNAFAIDINTQTNLNEHWNRNGNGSVNINSRKNTVSLMDNKNYNYDILLSEFHHNTEHKSRRICQAFVTIPTTQNIIEHSSYKNCETMVSITFILPVKSQKLENRLFLVHQN